MTGRVIVRCRTATWTDTPAGRYFTAFEQPDLPAHGIRALSSLFGKTTGRSTFVPLVFESGETFPFDWSED